MIPSVGQIWPISASSVRFITGPNSNTKLPLNFEERFSNFLVDSLTYFLFRFQVCFQNLKKKDNNMRVLCLSSFIFLIIIIV